MKVSVVIPTFNRCRLVSQAIESVLAQTFTDYEIIVIDDGSTDSTGETMAAYGDRILYYWQENQGESAARNRGVALAQGEHIAFLDSDDLWEPEKLQAQVVVLDTYPDVLMVGCQSWVINEQGHRLLPEPQGQIKDATQLRYGALRETNHFFGGGSTAIIRKAALGMEPFSVGVHFGEDWHLWLRLATQGRIIVVPRPLARLRQHRATQSYTITPDAVDHRLADHLYILGQHPCPPEYAPGPGLDPAIARVYLRAALDDLVLGRFQLARERLRLCIQSDDGLTLRGLALESAIDRAVALAQPTFVATPEVQSFFKITLSELQALAALSVTAERAAWARMYMALAAMARGIPRGNATIRRNLLQAVRADPGVCRRRAFWGGWLASLHSSRQGTV